jgi:hypothetical protein
LYGRSEFVYCSGKGDYVRYPPRENEDWFLIMHDQYCSMTDEDPKDCSLCKIIKMVRRDEQDKFSGDEEWDRQLVSEESYAKGYEEGYGTAANAISKAQPKVEGFSLDKIHQYIMDGISRRSVGHTEALYNLYTYLGGK